MGYVDLRNIRRRDAGFKLSGEWAQILHGLGVGMILIGMMMAYKLLS